MRCVNKGEINKRGYLVLRKQRLQQATDLEVSRIYERSQRAELARPTPWEEAEKEDAEERERIEERAARAAAGQVVGAGSDVCAEGRRVNSPPTRGPKRDFVPLVCRGLVHGRKSVRER